MSAALGLKRVHTFGLAAEHTGFLYKAAGGKTTGKWQQRWWKLDGETISYYKKSWDKKATKTHKIRGHKVGMVENKNRQNAFFIELEKNGRLLLSGETPEETRDWLQALVNLAGCVMDKLDDDAMVEIQTKAPGALSTFGKAISAVLPGDMVSLTSAPAMSKGGAATATPASPSGGKKEDDDDDEDGDEADAGPAWTVSAMPDAPAADGFVVAVLGSPGVGKTALILSVRGGGFNKSLHVPTTAPMKIDAGWDGASFSFTEIPSSTSESLRQATVKASKVIFLVFDVTNHASFEAIEGIARGCLSAKDRDGWMDTDGKTPPREVILVGTKSDMNANRSVTPEEVAMLCLKLGSTQYLETSVKKGDGVHALFSEVARISEEVAAKGSGRDYD